MIIFWFCFYLWDIKLQLMLWESICTKILRYLEENVLKKLLIIIQPESDGSRSGSSLSLRNIAGNDAAVAGNSAVQSPTHRGVHRSISASSTKPNRRASSGAETLRKFFQFHRKTQKKNSAWFLFTPNATFFIYYCILYFIYFSTFFARDVNEVMKKNNA